MPIFGNMAGLWGLLAIPAILAIHFLQQRAKVARTSTWFLIEKMAPDSARGRTWDRLRASRTLWLQLAAALVATWVLSEPRWLRAESAQTVVIVLDASASMEAFREPALAAAEREMSAADGFAVRTTWAIMTTDPRQPPLYRGELRNAATEALARWTPELGRHDFSPALSLARGMAGGTGRTLLITDSRGQVPPAQRVAGVGKPIDNVGFAGATIRRGENGWVGRALVKNHAATSQQRTWHIEMNGARSPVQTLTLAPDALVEISAPLPDGGEQAVVVLSSDGFTVDDRLALVRPVPKPLTVVVEGSDETAQFFRKLARGIDGVTVREGVAAATLRLARLPSDALARETRGGIFWAPSDNRAQVPLLNEPVTPERAPLVTGLNWQGWFGSGPHGYVTQPGDSVLLWHGRWPIVFVRQPGGPAGSRQLLLAFDWATSNASRLPATVLLARRFLEAERDAQAAPYTANFDCLATVPLQGNGGVTEPLTLTFQPSVGASVEKQTRVVPAAETAQLRAPGRVGFFAVRRGDEVLVNGATQFADARLGNFRSAETFTVEVDAERKAAVERNTVPDPFAVVWLVVLVALVLGSWWMRRAVPGSEATAAGRHPQTAEIVR